MKTNVHFRMLTMQCCGTLLCYINTRWPSYCSECGTHVIREVKEWVAVEDPVAKITYKRARTLQPTTGTSSTDQ